MTRLLIHLIGVHRGRVQTQAVAALLDVAHSSSGNDYCASAGKEELEIFLVALQSSVDTVREAALRALIIIMKTLPDINENYELGLCMARRFWIAKHDLVEENSELATRLFELSGLELPITMPDELLKDIIHPEFHVTI